MGVALPCAPGGRAVFVGKDTFTSPLFKALLNDDSSIDWSIRMRAAAIARLFGFLIPDKSDFERGRIESKKFFTFDDVEGELTLVFSSPDFFRCLSLLENSPRIPVEPDRGRKSPSMLSIDDIRGFIGDGASPPVSIRGIANWLKSCKQRQKNHVFELTS